MAIREIPRDDWSSFLATFSRRHEGWLCTVAVSDRTGAPHDETVDKPFVGAAADRDGDEQAISILVGGATNDHLSHVVRAPTRMRLVQTDEGADEALEVESRDTTTMLRFRTTMLPELVDGIATSSR
jgi:hypothetical protein